MKITEEQYTKLKRFGFGKIVPIIKENQEIVDELTKLYETGDSCIDNGVIKQNESDTDFLFRLKKKLGKTQMLLKDKDIR